VAKIKEYISQIILGVKNFQFFRVTSFPRLLKSLTATEQRVLMAATAIFLVSGGYVIATGYLGATVPAPDFGGKYVEGLVGQPRFINPALAVVNEPDVDLTRIIYSGLYKYDEQEKIAPDLAEGMPQMSPDQKQYKIKLRDKIFWHDGQPFSADDVVFTIQLIQNPQYQSPLRVYWNKVEVQKNDDRNITFVLKEPSSSFITNLTVGILPKHIWESIGPSNFILSKYNLQPIGTGPFKIKSLKKTDEGEIKSIVLTAFDKYLPRRPYLDQLEFSFYKTYDDLIASYHSKNVLGLGYVPFDKKVYVEKSSRINLYHLNLPRYQALFINRGQTNVLSDKNVRAALAQSLNRQEIIQEVYLGAATPAYGPIPKGFLGYNPGVEQANVYNLDNAKKLLQQAGFAATSTSPTLIKGTTNLEFTITTDSFPVNVKTAEILKRQWEAIGFRINLQILTLGELQQNFVRPRAYDAILFSEATGGDPDPFAYWHSSQRQDPGLNLSMFTSKEADQLINEARTNFDPAYRSSRYLRFQELIVNDIPAIFTVNSLYVYGVSSKIQGIKLENIVDPSQRFLDIADWYTKTKRVYK